MTHVWVLQLSSQDSLMAGAQGSCPVAVQGIWFAAPALLLPAPFMDYGFSYLKLKSSWGLLETSITCPLNTVAALLAVKASYGAEFLCPDFSASCLEQKGTQTAFVSLPGHCQPDQNIVKQTHG